jgi:hypothetical protein
MMQLLGVDFTSAPTRRKPITVARGRLRGAVLGLEGVDAVVDFAAFEALLATPGPWFGGLDFPFGLPREFVRAQALGESADAVVASVHRLCPTRMDFRALVDAWGDARPPGRRLVHRRTDTALPGVTSTSPLQTRYVPVGFMYYEGFARLVRAGVAIPRLRAGDPLRTAVEAYPRLLAHELIGARSYKNHAGAQRLIARKDVVEALEQGRSRLALRLKLSHALRDHVVDDAAGDRLDAVLCLVQAAWASRRADAGLPADVDPVEGWIVTG